MLITSSPAVTYPLPPGMGTLVKAILPKTVPDHNSPAVNNKARYWYNPGRWSAFAEVLLATIPQLICLDIVKRWTCR